MNTELEIEFTEMVSSLVKPGEDILGSLSAADCMLWHMATGIAGEGMEILEAVKKSVIYRNPLDRENVIEELSDCEFFMEGIRQALNITREETIRHNIDKLRIRYGKKYSNTAAIERKDKQ